MPIDAEAGYPAATRLVANKVLMKFTTQKGTLEGNLLVRRSCCGERDSDA